MQNLAVGQAARFFGSLESTAVFFLHTIAAWEYNDPDAACYLPPISDLSRCNIWHPHQHPAQAPLVNCWHKNIQHSGIPGLSFTHFHSGGDAMTFRVNGPDGLRLRVGYEYRDGANRHNTDSVEHVVGQSGVSFVSGTHSDGSPYPGPVDTFQLWESGSYSSTSMFWAKTADDEHACVYVYHVRTAKASTCSSPPCHRDQIPARETTSSFARRIQFGCFAPRGPVHSNHLFAVMTQRVLANASRNAGFSWTVSERALMSPPP